MSRIAALVLLCSLAPVANARPALFFRCSVRQGMKSTDVAKPIPANGQASFVVNADFVKGASVKFDILPTGRRNEYFMVTTTRVPSAKFAKVEKGRFSDQMNGTTTGYSKGVVQVMAQCGVGTN